MSSAATESSSGRTVVSSKATGSTDKPAASVFSEPKQMNSTRASGNKIEMQSSACLDKVI